MSTRFLSREPNAIWMREMRQQARIGRTPWVLFALTLSISLLMCSIGGIAATQDSSPATTGGGLFQVFFSIAYIVVLLIGPTLAANGIASEREGRTWEAVLLAGLSPEAIARGKFLAAYTTIALYIVVLAPVGALSFLFGGVTATEVVVAFAFLFALAAVAVAFGLAVSSLMTSLRGAIVVTLMLAACLGPVLYLTFGVGASVAIHKLWPAVPEGLPVWLPLAYSRATLGVDYVVFLLAFPLGMLGLPAWFLYELTIANLTGDADDRSTGLKRWFAVSTPLFALACALPSLSFDDDQGRLALAIGGVTALLGHLTLMALLFASEPAGPSRRVRIHWDRRRASAITRFFGPGLARTTLLVVTLGATSLAAVALMTIAGIEIHVVGAQKDVFVWQIMAFTSYAVPFFVFVVGLSTWVRSRGNTPWTARVITLAAIMFVTAGPWIVAAIAGVVTRGNEEDWIAIGGPSPLFALYMLASIDRASGNAPAVMVGLGCAIGWGAIGLVLMGAGMRRAHRAMATRDAAIAQADAALAAEDAARDAARDAQLASPP